VGRLPPLTSRRPVGVRLLRNGHAGAWAWVATASPAHWLLVRKHLRTGELAFHYCHVPAGQPVTLRRLVTAAGLRWPVEETFEFGHPLPTPDPRPPVCLLLLVHRQ
jgi:hypothetical protein